jgi:hypothetical protein
VLLVFSDQSVESHVYHFKKMLDKLKAAGPRKSH